jgi:hypothetical protein
MEVRNDKRTKRLPQIITSQMVFSVVVVIISLLIIAYGLGYRYNYRTFKVLKTGILVVQGPPNDAQVHVNKTLGKITQNKFSQSVTPGTYNVDISKDGFVTWHESLQVESSSINLFDNVVLFRSSPVISELTDTKKIAQLDTPEDILANANNDFLVKGYEIWIGDQLTARFSTPILRAIRYTDMSHVVYQQDDEIRVIENNGKNDTLLVKLSSPVAANFVIGNHGTELYYVDGGVNKMAIIR